MYIYIIYIYMLISCNIHQCFGMGRWQHLRWNSGYILMFRAVEHFLNGEHGEITLQTLRILRGKTLGCDSMVRRFIWCTKSFQPWDVSEHAGRPANFGVSNCIPHFYHNHTVSVRPILLSLPESICP